MQEKIKNGSPALTSNNAENKVQMAHQVCVAQECVNTNYKFQ